MTFPGSCFPSVPLAYEALCEVGSKLRVLGNSSAGGAGGCILFHPRADGLRDFQDGVYRDVVFVFYDVPVGFVYSAPLGGVAIYV